MPLLRSIAICLFGLPVLTLAAERPVRIASVEYPPYVSKALPQQGVLADLTVQAFAAVGETASIELLPWARAMRLTQAGKYDGLLLLWPEEVKKLRLHVSDTLYQSELGVFVRVDTAMQIKGVESLSGRRLGIVSDYGYPPSLLKSGALLNIAPDDKTNFRKLAADRLDMALLERPVGEYFLHHELKSLCGEIKWGGKALALLPLTIGFNGKPQLAQFNHGLKLLKANGQYQKIMAPLQPHTAVQAPGHCD